MGPQAHVWKTHESSSKVLCVVVFGSRTVTAYHSAWREQIPIKVALTMCLLDFLEQSCDNVLQLWCEVRSAETELLRCQSALFRA